MEITIRPLKTDDEFYWSVDDVYYWSVKIYGYCDEGSAPSQRKALKAAQKAGKRLAVFKQVKKCEDV